MLSSLVVAVMGIVAIFASQYRSVPTKGIVNFKDSVRHFLKSSHCKFAIYIYSESDYDKVYIVK